jgi:multidrug efflux system outer membrane protein
MVKRRSFLFFVGASLTGCAGVRKEAPPEAAVQVPPAWRASTAASNVMLQVDWWQSFGDATLNALVTEALSNSDDIALAAIRVREARAELGYAQAQRQPNVQAALEGGRDREVNQGFGIPEQQSAGEGLIQASFDVDLFGRLKAASAAARSALLATQDAHQTVRLGVAATVASAYFTLLAFDARLAIARETLKVRRDELHVEQRRYDAGYSNAL